MQKFLLVFLFSFCTYSFAVETSSPQKKLNQLESQKVSNINIVKAATATSAVGLLLENVRFKNVDNRIENAHKNTNNAAFFKKRNKAQLNRKRLQRINNIERKNLKLNSARNKALILIPLVTSTIGLVRDIKLNDKIENLILCNRNLAKASSPSNKIEETSNNIISTINFVKEN